MMTAKHWPEVIRELRMHKSEETHAVCARAIMEIEYQRQRVEELESLVIDQAAEIGCLRGYARFPANENNDAKTKDE